MPNLQQAADRMWHARPPVSRRQGGGGGALRRRRCDGPSPCPEAEAMKRLLLEWQIPAGALLLEERSRNSAENASMTQTLLQPRGIRRVLLVTSALHMARAQAHFETAGFEVIAAATDHEGRLTAHWPWWAALAAQHGCAGWQCAGAEGVGGAAGTPVCVRALIRYPPTLPSR